MVYKDAPTSEIHSFETFCSSQLRVESESSCFTIMAQAFVLFQPGLIMHGEI
jgi:hypothetical protein